MRRSWIYVAALAAIGLVVAVAAFISLQPSMHEHAAQESCSPRPCAAPQGFEMWVSEVSSSRGLLRLQVRFANHTKPTQFEAVSYRHTSTQDFVLELPGGDQLAPTFDHVSCPRWPELDVQRGASTGVQPLCFEIGSARLGGAVLVWSPDLGLLFRDVRVPLG